jgi:hypothetical protein
VLAAAGYNFGLLLRWLESFACPYRGTLSSSAECPIPLKAAPLQFFTDD